MQIAKQKIKTCSYMKNIYEFFIINVDYFLLHLILCPKGSMHPVKNPLFQPREGTLIKKKSNFHHVYIRKFRMEQLQSHIWLRASSDMGKYLRISSYIRKLFLIHNDFATAPLWISLYVRKILFYFLSVQWRPLCTSQLLHSFKRDQKQVSRWA